jgi:hypothetical protein
VSGKPGKRAGLNRVGLERMRDRTPDDRCPFCMDFLPPPGANGKKPKHCGDDVCERAYQRTYQRDRRRGLLVRHQRTVSAAPSGRFNHGRKKR